MIDHKWFPEIFDQVLGYLDWKELHLMRLTSRAVNEQVSSILYRHVVLCLDSSTPQRLRFVDPYHLKPLLLVDRAIPASARIRASRPPVAGVSLKEAVQRLTKHTQIVDFHGHERKGNAYKSTLQSVIAGANITRGVQFADQSRPQLQQSLFITFSDGRLRNTKLVDRTVTTSNLWWAEDELIVILTVADTKIKANKSSGEIMAPADLIDMDLCFHLGKRGHRVVSKVTAIKGSGTSGIDQLEWDRIIKRVVKRWSFRVLNSPAQHWPVTFSHTTAEEFQAFSRMSDLEFHLFTTVPGTPMPVPPTWKL